MATNCSDGIYTISYTDLSKNPIQINKKTLNQSVVDIALLGRARKEYGDVFDENILHILENFASPEDAANPGNPDLDSTYADLLSKPIEGQKWFNKTQKRMFIYDGSIWKPLGAISDVGGNSGVIAHGMSLPRPVSATTGYQFSYEECSWIVSMFNFPDQTDYAICTTNSSGLVTSQYTITGDPNTVNGYAFYQIIGIKSDVVDILPTPTPTPSVSITPSFTPSVTISATPMPDTSPTPTPTISNTPSVTPTLSSTPSVTRTPPSSPTPSVTPSRTKQPTPTPSPSVQKLGFNGQTYSSGYEVPAQGQGSAGVRMTCSYNNGYPVGWKVEGIRASSIFSIASGPLPANATKVHYSTTYRPDLGAGGSVSPGTLTNTASSITAISTNPYVTAMTKVIGPNAGTWETIYSIDVTVYDANNNILVTSSCIFHPEVDGSV